MTPGSREARPACLETEQRSSPKPCSAWPVYAPPILQGQQVCGLVAFGLARTLPEWIAACTACEHDHHVEHHRNAVAQ
jgi:hypothetical protein